MGPCLLLGRPYYEPLLWFVNCDIIKEMHILDKTSLTVKAIVVYMIVHCSSLFQYLFY